MRQLFDNEIDQVTGGTNYIDLNPGSNLGNMMTVTATIGSGFSSFNFSGIPFGSMQSAVTINFAGDIFNFNNTNSSDDPIQTVTAYRDVAPELTPGQVAALIGIGVALVAVSGGVGVAALTMVGADALTIGMAAGITAATAAAVAVAQDAIGGASGSGGNNHGGGTIREP